MDEPLLWLLAGLALVAIVAWLRRHRRPERDPARTRAADPAASLPSATEPAASPSDTPADASAERAQVVIERILRDFAALPHAHNEGTLYATFSGGLSCCLHYPTAGELTEAADHALLEAKRRGRNQVVIACPT